MKKKILVLCIGLVFITAAFAQEHSSPQKTSTEDAPSMEVPSDLPAADNTDIGLTVSDALKKSKRVDIYLAPHIFYENMYVPIMALILSLFKETGATIHTIGIGLDSQYIYPSGFTMYFNNQLGVFGLMSREILWPFIHYQLDFLLGYTFRPGNHLIGLSGGLTVGTGYPMAFVAGLTARLDYAYLFNQKVGFQISVTDSLGWPLDNLATAKIGCIVKL